MQTRPNIPQQVYDLAIARDLEGLRELQNEGHCLTQYHYQFDPTFNAVAKLALDGHGNAAEFLVDHLIGSINDLVLGYAHAGNVERTLHWVARGGDINFAADGLGYVGNIDIINAFFENCKALDFILKSFHYRVIFGLAKGLHHALLDQYLNLHFPESIMENGISHTRQVAIQRAIQGYAISHDEQGLALAATHNIDINENYYFYLSVNTPMESIPANKLALFLPMAARYGFDDPIVNYEGQLDHIGKYNLILCYYQGGHLPPQEMSEIKVTHIITSLYYYDHHSMIEAFLENPASELECAEKHHYGYYKYLEESPNGVASKLISEDNETQTRQLLQIRDDAKREHLLWLATGHSPKRTPENTPESLKLKRINHIFRKSPLGFDCAMALGSNQDRLIETLHLILFSLRGQDHLFSDHNVLPLIIAHLLNTTEANATKIHGHFAGVFAKHLKKDTIPASEAPTPLALKG